MTAKELYEYTKTLLFEKKNSRDYDGYYLNNINLLLSENFNLNNNYRAFYGKKPLYEIPFLENEDDEIPYEDGIVREVLSNGLAAKFCIDDDLTKFNLFNTNYLNAQANYIRFVEVE